MTLEELRIILEKTGYDTAYGKFKSEPSLPFIVYLQTGAVCTAADNRTYYKQPVVRIELYTDQKKNITAERKLEAVLDENDIEYDYDDVGLIESEGMYETVYTVTL